jgi:hexulose-6-phosphate isomerase
MEFNRLDRRQLLAYAAFSSVATGANDSGQADAASQPSSQLMELSRATKRYGMKKSINLWAFPYPERMSLRQCLELAKRAGFDGIELNYDLESDLSPKAKTQDFVKIRRMAQEIGIAISGLCSFLFWPYPLTSNKPDERDRAMELAELMTQAAHELETENLLVVPGAVHMPWRPEHEPTPNDVCDRRAREAVSKLLPQAEKFGVYLNMENIFFNGFLMSPMEMVQFVDSFQSPHVRVHFDTGNIMLFQFPEHWIPILGKRIKNVHLKEFTKKGTDFSLEAFRPLLDGSTNWPAVIHAFDQVGYEGYLTFEYFHPSPHYPEALIYQSCDSLKRMLGQQ